ncbi:MAG TPA: DJ-1/PfpI family protein [Telluria sp.]|nr:DJ-1/PfpI family protein [Telluria sp.]
MTLTPVYFLLLPGFVLSEVAGAADVLRLANRHGAAFAPHYVSTERAPASSLGLTLAETAPLPAVPPDGCWLVLPGLTPSASDAQAVRRAQAWLARVWRPDMRLITICSGALVAAGAGLLDGRRCTTHHAMLDQLRRLAPAARVEDDRIFVIDGPVASSAGVTTGVDLMLELLGRTGGPRLALAVAREMVVWLRRDGSSPQQSPLLDYRNHMHPGLHRVQDAIAADPARAWPLAELARIACVTPRHLTRLFQTWAGISPVEYRQRLQLALADTYLRQPGLALERVAEASGFGSVRDLRRVWLKQRGEALRRSKLQTG